MSSKAPFRGDLDAAHRRIEQLTADYEARIAGLQEENARLRKRLIDGDPKPQRKLPRIAIVLAVVAMVLAAFAIYLAAEHKSYAPQPVVIVESPEPPPTSSTHTPREPPLTEAERARLKEMIAADRMRRLGRDAQIDLPTCTCEAGDPLCADIPGVTCTSRR